MKNYFFLIFMMLISLDLYPHTTLLKGRFNNPKMKNGFLIIRSYDTFPYKIRDTVKVNNGIFKYTKDIKKYPESFAVFLTFISNDEREIQIKFLAGKKLIDPKNSVNEPMNYMRYFSSVIMLDAKSNIILGGDIIMQKNKVVAFTDNSYIKNEQTDINFKLDLYNMLKDSPDSSVFNEKLREFRHPFENSMYLIQSLASRFDLLDLTTVEQKYNAFSDSLKRTNSGKLLYKRITVAKNINKIKKNMKLIDTGGRETTLYTLIHQKNMLSICVFTASWCGPCRAEIPYLKEFYKHISGQKIQLISLSIDNNLEAWKKMVNIEEMPWPNFIAEKYISKENPIYKVFMIYTIPSFMIIDEKGSIKLKTRDFNNIRAYLTTQSK